MRDSLAGILQPGHEKKDATRQTILAARELGLISQGDGGYEYVESGASGRETALVAFEHVVLNSTDKEPYLARYYAYLLGLGTDAEGPSSGRSAEFVRHMSLENRTNPFNSTKEAALSRWFVWAGLGWTCDGTFVCNPYTRLQRSLSAVFQNQPRISADDFAKRLAEICPELDGGHIYRQVWPGWSPDCRRFTFGVSHALIDLHLTGRIILRAPPDARGWSVEGCGTSKRWQDAAGGHRGPF